MSNPTVTIDKLTVPICDEKNLLEVVRKAGIDLPTFCYHSDISAYGACRMCMVDVQGRGVLPACSTKAEPGMVVQTNTHQIRALRKIIIELMLADHDLNCTTCPKSGACRLQSIAQQLGIKDIRFQKMEKREAVDLTSKAIARDPGKCVLCGDCVRVCDEIQSVGALEFAYRGAKAQVVANFNRGIGDGECINCGQCVKACPVGALTIKTNITDVWDAIHDSHRIVVVQIAPAVRVALGEYFGEKPGTINSGKMVSALKLMGFDHVYDMCYGADFTVVEEGKELLKRYEQNRDLPIFTSCCPAWVKYAEQYYPDLLGNLSTARSPMQMFGALCKDQLVKTMNIPRERLVMVCVAPCTAKKFEAAREEFFVDGNPNVDYVITTEEMARMMKEHGIDFSRLELSSFDMPFGFSTGGGVIFGSSGGVSEAVLRFAAETLDKGSFHDFKQFRGSDGIKIGEIAIGDKTLKLGVVSGLANAKNLINKIRSGEEHFDLIEVMACPGGCVNGAGQPGPYDQHINEQRAKGLFDNDKMLQFHISNENPYLQKMYTESLDVDKIHKLLHTTYENRKRIEHEDLVLLSSEASGDSKLSLSICFGTSCFLRGAQDLYNMLMAYINEKGLVKQTEFKASFCGKLCKKGPILSVNGNVIDKCTFDNAVFAIEAFLSYEKK